MPVSLEELRRMADDESRTRGIAGYLYCDKCAYCLRTLPRVGYCPECGNLYDSRINTMKGIFTGREYDIPIGTAFGALVLMGFAIYAGMGWYNTREPRSGVIAIACGLVGAWYVFETYRLLKNYIVARITVYRIEQSRDDSGD